MMTERERKVTGAGLIAVGTLFLLVTNHLLVGWRHVWPLFPIAFGILSLRTFRSRGNPDLLFAGLIGAILGGFFLLFAFEMLDWSRMNALWPVIPLVVGGSLLASHFARKDGGSLIPEVAIILFALVAFLFTSERVDPRVASPFVHFWPLVLVLAGVVILKMRRDLPGGFAKPDAGMEAVRAVMEDVTQDDIHRRTGLGTTSVESNAATADKETPTLL
jgi:hypothetical protein